MATSGKEGTKHDHTMRDFAGVNTQASRQMIGDNEFSWLENVIPIGFGNMRAIPGPSAVLASWAPYICYFHQSANLNGVDYDYIFTTNGSGYQVNLTTFDVTHFALDGTFNGSGTSMAQWENTQIIIVDPTKGYFSWDGSNLTEWNGTVQSLTITALGHGYTTVPTITIDAPGGGGATATATSMIQVGLATLSAAGTDYIANDQLIISGGTFTTPAKIEVTTVNSSGHITGFALTDSGVYSVAPSNPASVSGGSGSSATFTLDFGIGPITITNVGSEYASDPAVVVSGGSGSGGAVDAALSIVPPGGTAVATYGGRVWVASGRTISFTSPGSFNDFTQGNAGGSFIISDESLHSSVQAMLSANNFLYIFGVTSVNVLSGVSVVAGVTVFTNTNISADVGSAAPYSLVPYNRSIWFYTPYGFQGLFGSTTQKTSDKLDGIFPLIDQSQPVTAGTCVIYNLRTLVFLVKYNDPTFGPRPLLAIYYEKKWFFSTQIVGSGLTSITSATINDIPTLFGTDGTGLYKLFTDTTSLVGQTIQTKLWDMGAPLREKQALKFGLEHIAPGTPFDISGTIQTENNNNVFDFGLPPGNIVQWINSSNVIVDWVNAFNVVVEWVGSGYEFQALDVEVSGFYLGVTLFAGAQGSIYQGIHFQYELRAHWP